MQQTLGSGHGARLDLVSSAGALAMRERQQWHPQWKRKKAGAGAHGCRDTGGQTESHCKGRVYMELPCLRMPQLVGSLPCSPDLRSISRMGTRLASG